MYRRYQRMSYYHQTHVYGIGEHTAAALLSRIIVIAGCLNLYIGFLIGAMYTPIAVNHIAARLVLITLSITSLRGLPFDQPWIVFHYPPAQPVLNRAECRTSSRLK